MVCSREVAGRNLKTDGMDVVDKDRLFENILLKLLSIEVTFCYFEYVSLYYITLLFLKLLYIDRDKRIYRLDDYKIPSSYFEIIL